ncbi:unnamed protein product [Eruca vesicaria subsp. sativa]|uniref:RNA polymerase II subunit 5-mediating protein n=1 Tax=Eruca vesicaria subsp. sativa TaxID=29727 RepID=A0ABC8JDD3_ERUVS|nr:unnamed protein product [Eruca vesicaria subsp. sativa]
MEPPQKKGTVTPLGSLFSEEEARKAASYVEERIREKREEMNRLQQFVDENDNLISLVKKLPEKLHHNVMVPFGKKAFFPGRLIHTNECLVFLGENYYTDRTSKQTVDVLRRRDKTLQSQIHSIKAEIDDFQTEASFFANTASEVAEGLLEIREEYEDEEEEVSSATVPQPGVKKESSGFSGEETAEGEVEDDEFARIMSKLNELEMEEEQEDEDGEDKSEEHDSPVESVEDMVKGLGDETKTQETTVSVLEKVSGHSSSVGEPRYSETRVKAKAIHVLPETQPHKDTSDPSTCIGPKPQYIKKEDQSRGGIPQQNAETWRDFQATSAVSRVKVSSSVVGPQKIESIQKPEAKFDTNKAFTGSIVEHTHNMQQPSGFQPPKPVSRFRAQRR